MANPLKEKRSYKGKEVWPYLKKGSCWRVEEQDRILDKKNIYFIQLTSSMCSKHVDEEGGDIVGDGLELFLDVNEDQGFEEVLLSWNKDQKWFPITKDQYTCMLNLIPEIPF